MTKIQHKRSSVLVSGAAKAPTSAQLDYGELAINYSSTDPQLFIKDSSGSVISLLSSYAPLDGATFTGDVNFDAEAIIRGDLTNSGALTLNSETNAKYVKIQAPANSSLTSYTLTLPNDDGSSGEVLSTDGSGGLSWAYAAMSTADKNKLDGIEAGATVSLWTVSGSDTYFTGGSAGVGTNSPSYPIDIVSDVNAVAANIRGRSSDNVGTLAFRSNDNAATYGLVQARNNEFRITTNSSSQPIVFRTDSEKLRITGSGDVKIPNDNGKFMAGAGDDLQMYHDGTTSYIESINTGLLILKGSNIRLRSSSDERIINAHQNGSVDLFYDDSKKFETTSTGVAVAGNLTCDTITINSGGGAGSGINADLLDSMDSSAFLRASGTDDFMGVLQGNNPGGTYFNLRGGLHANTLILRVSAADHNDTITSNLSSDYGFNIRYRGDLSGVENALQIDADNQTGSAIEALRIKQNGVTYFGPTPLVGTNTIWHAGNDGAGSGLDADNLDGYGWTTQGKDIRGTEIYADNWFRNYNDGEGLHNEATGVHWHSDGDGYWTARDHSDYIGIKLKTNGSNIRGYVYANNSNQVGFLDSDGGWAIRHTRDARTEFYINSTEYAEINTDYFTHSSDIRTPIFYDSNNTNYYLDPAGTTNINTLYAGDTYSSGWFRNTGAGAGLYNQNTGAHFYANSGNGVWNITGNSSSSSTSLIFRGSHQTTVHGWIHAENGWMGVLNRAGQWALKHYNIDGYSPNLWFDEEGNETWTGNPGSDIGKIEYHSNRFYIASGSNSTEILRLRRSGSDVAYFDNSGNLYAPILYDNNNTSYYCDPASHSNLNTARFQGNACYIRGGSPTLYFQDTNENSAMIHNNSNLLYVLRGGTDQTNWSQVSGQWPFIFYLSNNNAKCGGSFEAVGNITAYSSDRRLKQNFKPIESALDKVHALNGLHFDWKPEVIDLGFTPDQMTDDIGLIAQDVQAVLPQAVKPAPFDQTWDDELNKTVSTSGEDYITIQYERLVPLLVEAIKELSVRLTSLENKS